MTDSKELERRRQRAEEIKFINLVRGPESQEKADWYVEQGVMSADQAAFWLENRRRVDAFLDHDFERRLQALDPVDLLKLEHAFKAAYQSQPRRRGGRQSMDRDPEILAGYALFLERKRRDPRLSLKFCAARIGVRYGTLKRWHAHFRWKLPAGAEKIIREQGAK